MVEVQRTEVSITSPSASQIFLKQHKMSLTEQGRQMSQNEIAQHIQTLLPMIKHEDSISVKRPLQTKSVHSFQCGADKRSTKKFNSTFVGKRVTMVLTGLFTKHEMQQNKNYEMLETIKNTSIEAIVDVKTEDHIVLQIPSLQLFVRATPNLSYRLLHDSVKSHRAIHLSKRSLQTLVQTSNPSKQAQFQQLKDIILSSRHCINNAVDFDSVGSDANGSDGGSDSSYCESYAQSLKRKRSCSGSIKSESNSKRLSPVRKPFHINSEHQLLNRTKQEARGSNVLKVRQYETLSLRQRQKYDRFVTCRVGSFVEYYTRGLYTRTQVTSLTATDFEILNTSKIKATVVFKNTDGLVLHIAATDTLHHLTTSQVGYYVNNAKRCTPYTEKIVQALTDSRNSSSNNSSGGFRHSDSARDVVRWQSLERLIYNSTRRISESQLITLRRQTSIQRNDYSANDVDDNGDEFIIYDSENEGSSDSGCSGETVVMTADYTPLSACKHPDNESVSLVSTESVKSEPLHIVSSDSGSGSDTGSDGDTDSCDDSVIISQESKYQRGLSGDKRKCTAV